MIVGCIVFFQLWNLFDCVDGEVARVTNDLSLGGRYLEEIHNPIIESIFMACFGIGLFTLWDNIVFLYIGFTFAMSICLVHNFNRSRYYIAQTEKKESYKFPLTPKKSILGRTYRSIYRKVRLLFILPNTYLIFRRPYFWTAFSNKNELRTLWSNVQSFVYLFPSIWNWLVGKNRDFRVHKL